MKQQILSIRPFIGAKNFDLSRDFYRTLGFQEGVLTPKMSLFELGRVAFYLQDYYAKDWIDNTMVFIEVEDVNFYYQHLLAMELPAKYPGARLSPIRTEDWGSECFLHDPSGVLWHFGQFSG